MPKEIFPSSFEWDWGHKSDFFEHTVRDMKAMSQKKKVYLADSAPEEHTIVFYRGKMVEIQCPKQPQSRDTKRRSPKKRATTRGIPDAVKTDVEAIVQHFNTTVIRNRHCVYVPRYKGKILYLDRQDYGRLSPICRLEYGSLVISGVPNYLIFQANKVYPDRSRWVRWNKCLTFRMP